MTKTSPINSGQGGIVTPDEMERLENDPELILRLVDLIFLSHDEGRAVPS